MLPIRSYNWFCLFSLLMESLFGGSTLRFWKSVHISCISCYLVSQQHLTVSARNFKPPQKSAEIQHEFQKHIDLGRTRTDILDLGNWTRLLSQRPFLR